MNKLQENLLGELLVNSRQAQTTLAKKLGTSRELVNYHMKQLEKKKIIQKYITIIDTLDNVGAAVFIKVKATANEKLIDYFHNSSFVSWVAELTGVWHFGFSILGKTNEEVDKRFKEFYNIFKEDILSYRFTFHKKNSFYYEKIMGKEKTLVKVNKIKIDEKDKKILQLLSEDARIEIVNIAKEVKLTAPAVLKRIRNLENSGAIQQYTVFVDLSKLDLYQYSVFIENKNVEQLIPYMESHSKVSFIAEYIGDPFIEIGVVVKDPYELRLIIQQIEEKFPQTSVIETSLFHQDVVSVGPPSCVFE